MKKLLYILLTAGFCGAVLSAAAMAQGLPVVKTNLPADTQPKPIGEHGVRSTKFIDLRYGYHEGVAVVRATVTKDGTLKNMRLIRLAGEQSFADTVLDQIKDWHYQPATRNGQPVDYPNYDIEVRTFLDEPERGAIGAFRKSLRRGVKQANAGNYDESISTLLPTLSRPRLNFYERGILTLQLGLDYLQKHDDLTAREYFSQTELIGDRYLPSSMRPVLWRMAMIAHSNTRRYFDVRYDYKSLKALGPVDADTSYAKLAAEAEKEIKGTDRVVAPGRIGTVSPLATWQYPLLRHIFSIQNISGSLSHIELLCYVAHSDLAHGISSPISDQAEWHVPKKWQDCSLTVFGKRGTTFYLVQSADKPTVQVASHPDGPASP